MSSTLLGLDYHVIYVYFNELTDLVFKHSGNHSLISGSYILQPKRHFSIMVVSIGHDEGGFLLVLGCYSYLMVPLESIQKPHSLVLDRCVHQLVYHRYQERVLWTCSVKVGEINANPPLTILLFYNHRVG